MESRHLSVVIRRDWRDVAAFAGDPARLPEWAEGLAAEQPELEGDVLMVHSPMGLVRVRFAPPNDLGVLDHEVTLPTGESVRNPMRVLAHPLGAEVVFTLRRPDGVAADVFEADCAAVASDLERLRAVLET